MFPGGWLSSFDMTSCGGPTTRNPSALSGTTQTLDTASRTIREAEGIWLMTFGLGGGTGSLAGIYSGRLVATSSDTFKLVRYSAAPGVELTGKIRFLKFGPPNTFDGVITVRGAAASHGLLGFLGNKVGGTLGGSIVSN